jgi:hypothetical protein
MDVIRPSADSGGSDGTTIKVFLQEGHRKQFRAHLRKSQSEVSSNRTSPDNLPVLLSPDARARDLKQTIRTVIPADLEGDTSVAPYRIALLAEVEVMNLVIRGRGRREIRRWRKRIWVQTRTVNLE